MSISTQEYTVAEVARQLRTTEPALRHAIVRGHLPVIRRLGRVKVTPEGIEQFIRQRTR